MTTDGWLILEAVGTAGGFLTAAGVYAQSYATGRRSQAERVSAWFTLEAVQSDGISTETLTPAMEPKGFVVIKNASDQPVYEVRLWPLRHVTQPLALGVLPPNFEYKTEGPLEVLMPHEVLAADLLLEFRDAAGKKWTRTPQGKIRRAWWFRWVPRRLLHRRRPIKDIPEVVWERWRPLGFGQVAGGSDET
jgi:hypothetical protein